MMAPRWGNENNKEQNKFLKRSFLISLEAFTFHYVRADNLKLQLKNIFISWYWTLFINWYWYWHEEKLNFEKWVLCTSAAWGVSEHSNTTPFPDSVTPFSEFLTHKAPSHEVAPSPSQILCTYAWSGPQGSVPRPPEPKMPLWALCSASFILMFIRSWRATLLTLATTWRDPRIHIWGQFANTECCSWQTEMTSAGGFSPQYQD